MPVPSRHVHPDGHASLMMTKGAVDNGFHMNQVRKWVLLLTNAMTIVYMV